MCLLWITNRCTLAFLQSENLCLLDGEFVQVIFAIHHACFFVLNTPLWSRLEVWFLLQTFLFPPTALGRDRLGCHISRPVGESFFNVPSSVQGPQSCSCPTWAWNRVWVSGFLLLGPVPRSHPPWSCPSPLLLLTPGFKFSLISDTWGFLFLPFKLSCTLKKREKKSWFPFWSAPRSSSWEEALRFCTSLAPSPTRLWLKIFL